MQLHEIPGDTKLSDLNFVAFDVETTGLSPVANRLVELSGVRFNNETGEVDTFSSLIDPETPIPPLVTNIHGITDEMVVDAPKAREVVEQFRDWAGKDVVFMAHNAPFDVEFLRVNFARAALDCPTNPVVDTLILAKDLLDTPNHKLETVVESLNLPSGEYHRALADSVHVKDVFLRLQLDYGLETWSQLLIYGCVSKFNHDTSPEELEKLLPAQTLETFHSLQSAIKTKQMIRMVYNGTFRQTRTVRPLNVIVSRGNCYLNAFCQASQAERTFRVDRISRLNPLAL
ncbi:MAG: WYL domain-containing protein [Cyanobacteria bacterium]|nr:WYL domain-containing protein [Cyanobacteriota bacterium]